MTGGVSCQVSTAIRAPQVLLWLTGKPSERRRTPCCLSGVDWGERHHDVCLLDQDGSVLAARRITDGLAGVGELHTLVAAQAEDPGQVAVGIETDRGLLVAALLAAGYQVSAVNPQVVSHYRGRHRVSRAKSDRGDAKVLADLVRIDRNNHRQVAGDSPLAEAVKVLAGVQPAAGRCLLPVGVRGAFRLAGRAALL
jgi:Transposase